jgi:hypothetical protein
MAGAFMLAIGLSLLGDWRTVALAVEAILVVALGAVIFGRFCLGLYLLLHVILYVQRITHKRSQWLTANAAPPQRYR